MPSPGARFTMGRMMVYVSLIAVGLGATRYAATRHGAEGVLAVALTIISAAIFIPQFRMARPPRFWVGFGVCGIVYLSLAFFFLPKFSARMPTSWLLDGIHDRLPASLDIPADDFITGGQAVLSLVSGVVGGLLGLLVLPAMPEGEPTAVRPPFRAYFPTPFACWDRLRGRRP